MKNLLQYILENITGSSDFEIIEAGSQEGNENYVNYEIKANPEIIGLIIGKSGKTIRSIRNLLRVRATLDNKGVSVSVNEA